MSFTFPQASRPIGSGRNLDVHGVLSAGKLSTKEKLEFSNGVLSVSAGSPSTLQFTDSAGTAASIGGPQNLEDVLTEGNDANSLAMNNVGSLSFKQADNYTLGVANNIDISTSPYAAWPYGGPNTLIPKSGNNTYNAVAIGQTAFAGVSDIVIGARANYNATTSYESVIIGYYAGFTATPQAHGSRNVFVGKNAGYGDVNTKECVCIGPSSNTNTGVRNAIAFGHIAKAEADNTIAIGFRANATSANTLAINVSGLTQGNSGSISTDLVEQNSGSIQAVGANAYLNVTIGGNVRKIRVFS